MKKQILVYGALFVASALFAVVDPHVDQAGVTFTQETTSRKVTIGYTLADAPAVVTVDIQTRDADTAVWSSIGVENYPSLAGDLNQIVQPGAHTVTWQPDRDWPDRRLTNSVRAVVTAWALDKTPDYMVIGLDDQSKRFYVSAAAVPGGVTNDVYKTKKILMRRVAARGETWRMGGSFSDVTRNETGNRELPHYVTLTADYYLGVYEVTEAQWCGGAWQGLDRTSKQPATNMSYNDIRGDGSVWPAGGHAVGGALAALRTLTGVPFDLPTEAQWEFACRATKMTQVNFYDWVGTIDDYAWHNGRNESWRHEVGLLRPNDWGFYDVYGNVAEWCLDWYGDTYYGEAAAAVDPAGAATGSARVKRGGCFAQPADSCARSAYRDSDGPSYRAVNQGLRLCCGADLSQYGVDADAAFASSRNRTFSYTLTGTNAIVTVDIQTNVVGTAEWVSIGAAHAKTFAGEVNKVVTLLDTPLTVTWFPDLDWPGQEAAAGTVRAVFTFWDLSAPPDYMSVDLGASGDCRRFYTCADAIPGDLADGNHPCRHSRMLMRRIPAAGATFRMGSPTMESGRKANEAARLVTFSEDFYMAVFETTEGQYSSGVWGRTNSDSPRINENYYEIRGSTVDWPTDGHAVSDSSPLARLRLRTGIPSFDLPTEAQWEFASRAGSPSAFGAIAEADLTAYAWYTANSGGVLHDVGKKKPNAWGLYDMFGNVLEWVLDWYADYDPEDVVDPRGPVSGSNRCKRGGYFWSNADICRCAKRDSDTPGFKYQGCGFRLCCGVNVNAFTDGVNVNAK